MTHSENKQVKLSVVIAAWNGVSHLHKCLSSLAKQIESAGAEVIVVSNFEDGISETKMQFLFAKHIILSSKATVPQLRARGILESQGAIIALSEDFCTFNADWCREIEKAHELPYAVIGGAIENASIKSALAWAVYFYDYGKYMPPNQVGVTDALSGANISYKREILDEMRKDYEDGFFESFVNDALVKRGENLYLMPSAIVYHKKNYELKKTIFQFYHQARSFAARRVSGSSPLKRLLFISASLILPVLLPARIVIRIINKQRYFKELVLSLPFLIILMSVWAFGEFSGCLTGEGESNRHWR